MKTFLFALKCLFACNRRTLERLSDFCLAVSIIFLFSAIIDVPAIIALLVRIAETLAPDAAPVPTGGDMPLKTRLILSGFFLFQSHVWNQFAGWFPK